MTIKTTDGNYEVASKSKADAAMGFGIAGLVAGLAGSHNGLLGGLFGGNARSEYVTKDELKMAMDIAQKDSTIALLQSEKTTDAKLVDVYKASSQQDREIRDLIALNKAEQAAVNAQQMAYNAAANASIDVLKSQVMALQSVTKVYIPSNNVCQSQCGCGCVGQ